MRVITLIIALLCLFSFHSHSQSLEKGFDYLTTGDYVAASEAFHKILAKDASASCCRLWFSERIFYEG
jgi:hypothetical protein